MTPVLAPRSKLQMDGSPRLIRVERMDLFKNHFFIQDLSAGIVFGSIFQTSEAAERFELFLQNVAFSNIEF